MCAQCFQKAIARDELLEDILAYFSHLCWQPYRTDRVKRGSSWRPGFGVKLLYLYIDLGKAISVPLCNPAALPFGTLLLDSPSRRQRTGSSSEHYVSDLRLLKADAL